MAYLLSGRAMVSFFLCPVVWRGRPVRLPEYHERKQLFGLTKQVFPLVEFFVLSWRNFCFLLMKLLFRLEETFVFCWWNFYFH